MGGIDMKKTWRWVSVGVLVVIVAAVIYNHHRTQRPTSQTCDRVSTLAASQVSALSSPSSLPPQWFTTTDQEVAAMHTAAVRPGVDTQLQNDAVGAFESWKLMRQSGATQTGQAWAQQFLFSMTKLYRDCGLVSQSRS